MLSFLRLVNYCRKYIKNLSTIAAPLFELVSNKSTDSQINEKLASIQNVKLIDDTKKEFARMLF